QYHVTETRVKTERDSFIDAAEEFSSGYKKKTKLNLTDEFYFIESSGLEKEINSIFTEIYKNIIFDGVSLEDIVILWNPDSTLREIILEKSKLYGIPVEFYEHLEEYLPLKRYLIEILQLIRGYPSADNLMLILKDPISEIPIESVEQLEIELQNNYFQLDCTSLIKHLTDNRQPDMEAILEFLKKVENINIELTKASSLSAGINVFKELFLNEFNLLNNKRLLSINGTYQNFKLINNIIKNFKVLLEFNEISEQPDISKEEIIESMISVISSVIIPSIRNNFKGVRVIDFSSAREMHFEYVYIINLGENTIPAPGKINPFFSYSEILEINKKRPRTFFEHTEKVLGDRYLFYLLLKTARKRMYFCYDKYNEDGVPQNISPFIHEMKKIVSEEYYEKHVSLTTPDKIIPELPEIFNMPDFNLRIIYNLSNTSSPIYGYLQKFSDDDLFNMYRILTNRIFTFKTTLNENNKKILKSFNIIMDQTKLTSYLGCPFQFFISQILKVQPIETGAVPTRSGENVHKILDSIFKKLKKAGSFPVNKITANELEKMFNEIFENFPGKFAPGAPPYYEFLERETVRKNLLKFIRYEYVFLTNRSEFIPEYFEDKIGFEDVFLINYKDVQFRFGGKVDRIDSNGESLIVGDYKYSKITRNQLAKNIVDGIQFQIPLYIYMVQEKFGKDVIGGELIGIKSQVRSSIFDNSYKSLIENKKVKYFDFKSMNEFYVAKATALYNMILSGDFSISPIDPKHPCDYCPSSNICRFKLYDWEEPSEVRQLKFEVKDGVD
ncbi:MAG: PD-(D/E)XK nuclease family protein, partial [bacterium]|nr:PD-(D/E)XK nuclease family protein [bacterium]